MRRGIGVIILLGAVALFGCDGPYERVEGEWTFIQLTDNDLRDYDSDIDGDVVVWVGEEGFGRRREIFMYDGTQVRQLTDDRFSDEFPQVSGSTVVWRSNRPQDPEDTLGAPQVMIYDGSAVRQLTTGLGVYQIDVDGPYITWAGLTEQETAGIFLFDGEDIREITSDARWSQHPVVSAEGNVAWTGWDGEDWQIFLHQEGATRVAGLARNQPRPPQISGQNVAWVAGPHPHMNARDRFGRHKEVYVYDGNYVRQLTDNEYEDAHVAVSGQNAVWQSFDGHDYEIFLFDGWTVTRLTDNQHDDLRPVISGSNVAWAADLPDSREIFFFDGQAAIQLTNDEYEDRLGAISGSTVVYEHWDGNDWEIRLAVRRDQTRTP